jgi:hypothetical protein
VRNLVASQRIQQDSLQLNQVVHPVDNHPDNRVHSLRILQGHLRASLVVNLLELQVHNRALNQADSHRCNQVDNPRVLRRGNLPVNLVRTQVHSLVVLPRCNHRLSLVRIQVRNHLVNRVWFQVDSLQVLHLDNHLVNRVWFQVDSLRVLHQCNLVHSLVWYQLLNRAVNHR